ncbi:MAG: ferredoxin [Oligoflexia bacterium]|nr:ferredoxin [Oligoflexia bacterium]
MKFDPKARELKIVTGCIVCKTCEFTASQIFQVEEKSLTAKVLRQPREEETAAILEAIKLCPEKVIHWKPKK